MPFGKMHPCPEFNLLSDQGIGLMKIVRTKMIGIRVAEYLFG